MADVHVTLCVPCVLENVTETPHTISRQAASRNSSDHIQVDGIECNNEPELTVAKNSSEPPSFVTQAKRSQDDVFPPVGRILDDIHLPIIVEVCIRLYPAQLRQPAKVTDQRSRILSSAVAADTTYLLHRLLGFVY